MNQLATDYPMLFAAGQDVLNNYGLGPPHLSAEHFMVRSFDRCDLREAESILWLIARCEVTARKMAPSVVWNDADPEIPVYDLIIYGDRSDQELLIKEHPMFDRLDRILNEIFEGKFRRAYN